MPMPLVTIAVAAVLILLGVVGYFGGGMQSITALIPAFFGVVVALGGGIAFKWRTPGVVFAALIALLGFGGTMQRLIKVLTEEDYGFNFAVMMQILMALTCLAYLVLVGVWFAKGRKPAAPAA